MTSLQKIYYSLREVFYAFVRYRLHISLVFFFLLYYNNIRIEEPINWFLIISFGLWHFALFLFDRVYDRKLDLYSQPDEYVKDKYSYPLYGLVLLLLLSSFFFYILSESKLFYWIILLPVTFLYPLRIFKDFRIKKIFFIKNFFSAAIIFCMPLVFQFIILSGYSKLNIEILQPHLSLFIYVLVGEVYWDIRDSSADKKFGIATIPNTFGLLTTKIYMASLILIDSYISSIFFSGPAILYFILIIFIHENSSRALFHLPPLIALIRFLI